MISIFCLYPATNDYFGGICRSAVLNALYACYRSVKACVRLSRSYFNPSLSNAALSSAILALSLSTYICAPYTITLNCEAANDFILIALWILPKSSDKYDIFC